MRRLSIGVLGLLLLLFGVQMVVAPSLAPGATAQNTSGNGAKLPVWMAAVWKQARIAPLGQILLGSTPSTIPQSFATPNANGIVTSFQPSGATKTSANSFFAPLGTNGRTCFTCHQPQSGWSITPAVALTQFLATNGRDPLFAPVDGANCPDVGAAAKTLLQKATASSQLLLKGNIRIFLPVPSNAEYTVRVIRDPYGCETSPTYGLPSGVISMYRRVLNSTNLTMNGQFADNTFQTVLPQGAIMWDGREPTLESQFINATLGHAQAGSVPTGDVVAQGVTFEKGIFTAQTFDQRAGSLTANGATGGPVALSNDLPMVVAFFGNEGMNMFDSWSAAKTPAQASIKRGQDIYNNRQFVVQNLPGINGDSTFPGPLPNPVSLSCANCHSNQNSGSDVAPDMKRLGVGDNSSTVSPPTPDQPLLSFLCPTGSIPFFSNPVTINGVTYDDFRTSDPGVGLITGKCKDLGVFKVPRLRGLAAHAPFFHNGSAATLGDVVDFYNKRFNMGLSAQDRQDLINFLGTL